MSGRSDIYSSGAALKNFKGVDPQDLHLETEDELLIKLEEYLAVATDLINRHRNRNFLAEVESGDLLSVPEIVTDAALRIGANRVAIAKAQKRADLMKVDEYRERIVGQRIFTQDIKDDLEMIPRGTYFDKAPGGAGKTRIKMSRVKSRSELAWEEAWR